MNSFFTFDCKLNCFISHRRKIIPSSYHIKVRVPRGNYISKMEKIKLNGYFEDKNFNIKFYFCVDRLSSFKINLYVFLNKHFLCPVSPLLVYSQLISLVQK